MGNSSSTEGDKFSDKKKALEEKLLKQAIEELRGKFVELEDPDPEEDDGMLRAMAGVTAYHKIYNDLNNAPDDIENSNVFVLAKPMLYVSALIYTLAELRKVLKNEKSGKFALKNYIVEENARRAKKKALVPDVVTNLYHSLIRSEEEPPFKNKIDAENLLKFITENEALLDKNLTDDFSNDLNLGAIIGLAGLKGAYVCNFDDNEPTTEMVYGICVNPAKKKITVVFRGTVPSFFDRDVATDLDVRKTPVEIPEDLLQEGDEKEMFIHNGFLGYMTQKIDAIVEKLTELFEDYTTGNGDYFNLFVTGHSLGGALATFGAFKLATDKRLQTFLVNKPVICISFASPRVGDPNWGNAFEALEKQGRIRHIRISNEKDVVPTIPPFLVGIPPWSWTGSPVVHTGVNIFLLDNEKKYVVGRGTQDDESFSKQFHGSKEQFSRSQFIFHPIKSSNGVKANVGKFHSNPECWRRMQGVQTSLKEHTIPTLYGRNEEGGYKYDEPEEYTAV